MKIVRRSSFRATPWKNGGGTTFEALRFPPSADPFAWRVSVAEVGASGPFSDFSGYRRHMVLLRGAGVRLQFGDGRDAALRETGDLIAFDGALATQCALLAGPCVDLNLIVADRFDSVQARVDRIDLPLDWGAGGVGTQLVFVIAGSLVATDAGGGTARLEPWDLAWRVSGEPWITTLTAIAAQEPVLVFRAQLSGD